jgi:hypothetical protein
MTDIEKAGFVLCRYMDRMKWLGLLNPLQHPDESGENAEEKQIRRQKAFEHFRQYRGILPADFDFRKELAEYRNEHYGYID